MEPEKPFADDQDVEITDLPGSGNEAPGRTRGSSRRPARSRRQHLFRWIGIVILGVCCLALLLRATPGLNGSLLTGIFGPVLTPTASSGPDIHLFYVNAEPPWGSLSIDGKRQARLPDMKASHPVQLAPGSHRLVWQAAPFSPQSCVVSVPSSFADTCTEAESVHMPDGQAAWIIDFTDSMFTLSANQQIALSTEIQQALNTLQASDLVQPGEQFLDMSNGTGASSPPSPAKTTQQTLHAILHLTRFGYLQGDSCMGANTPNSCNVNGQDCHMLCTLGNQGNVWNVAIVVGLSWTYTTLSGRVLAENRADEYGTDFDHLLPITITWDGARWHVQAAQRFMNGPIPCVAASDQNTLGNAFGTSSFQAFNWLVVPAPDIAAGCLIVLTSLSKSTPSPSASERIVFLHRFGVFIAINRLAQEYDASAPHPTAYEMNLARALAAQGHISFS